jgi:hypothetical protein
MRDSITRFRVFRNHPNNRALRLGGCRAWHVAETQHDRTTRELVYQSPFMYSFDTWQEAMAYAKGELQRKAFDAMTQRWSDR